MQVKYNSFYSHLELPESEQVSSDLDNFGCILNQKLYQCHFDRNCSSNHQLALYKYNARVSEIPTVCLVTCVQTEFLPQLQFWTKQNLKKDQQNNTESYHKRSMSDRGDKSSWKCFSKYCENEKLAQKEGDQYYDNENRVAQINLNIKSLGQLNEDKKDKEFVIFRTEKQKNQIIKIMHQGLQIKSTFHNTFPSNINSEYQSFDVFMQIFNVLHQNEIHHGIKNDGENSVKSCFSSCSDLSIKSDNLRMIDENFFKMNQNGLKNQDKSNGTNKYYAKRKRDSILYNQPSKSKYSKTDMIFCERKSKEDKFEGQIILEIKSRIRVNEGIDQILGGQCFSEYGCSVEKLR